MDYMLKASNVGDSEVVGRNLPDGSGTERLGSGIRTSWEVAEEEMRTIAAGE
jgi:hypothetical protein